MTGTNGRSSRLRVGQSAYELPRWLAEPASVTTARGLLLRALRDETPILADLADRPFRAYIPATDCLDASHLKHLRAISSAADAYFIPGSDWNAFTAAEEEPDQGGEADADPACRERVEYFTEQLRDWADRWHVAHSGHDWLLDRAVATLRWWHADPAHCGSNWNYDATVQAINPLTTDEQRIAFESTYDPTTEFENIAVARLKAEFASFLVARMAEVAATAKAKGLRPTPTKYTGSRDFRWLARHLGGEPYGAIARREAGAPTSEAKVKKAVERARALVGLPSHGSDAEANTAEQGDI